MSLPPGLRNIVYRLVASYELDDGDTEYRGLEKKAQVFRLRHLQNNVSVMQPGLSDPALAFEVKALDCIADIAASTFCISIVNQNQPFVSG